MNMLKPITTVVYGPYVGFVSLDCFRAITNLAEGTKLYSEEQIREAHRSGFNAGNVHAKRERERDWQKSLEAKRRALMGSTPKSMWPTYAELANSEVYAPAPPRRCCHNPLGYYPACETCFPVGPKPAPTDVDKALFLIYETLSALNSQLGEAGQKRFVSRQCEKLLAELNK